MENRWGEGQGQTWLRPLEAKGKSVRAGLHAGAVDFLLCEKRVFNYFVVWDQMITLKKNGPDAQYYIYKT